MRQTSLSVGGGNAELEHENGELGGAAGLGERGFGAFGRRPRHLTDNPNSAGVEFFVGVLDIYHQVAVGFADFDHGTGGDHIENQLLRRTAFEAC